MPNTALTQGNGKKLVKLLITCMLVQIAIIGYVFYLGYEGRSNLVTSQRRGCERSKKDRMANATGWRIAEAARRADGQISVADEYKAIAEGLETRSRIKCEVVFPKASIVP